MRPEAADQSQIHVVIERVAVIEHDHGPPARSEHPVNLSYGAGRIRCVVKYAMGIHEVKGTVSERQVLSVALDETPFQSCQLKTSPRYAHRRVGQVNRGVVGTGAREEFGLAAASATDFEHVQATGFFKANRRL